MGGHIHEYEVGGDAIPIGEMRKVQSGRLAVPITFVPTPVAAGNVARMIHPFSRHEFPGSPTRTRAAPPRSSTRGAVPAWLGEPESFRMFGPERRARRFRSADDHRQRGRDGAALLERRPHTDRREPEGPDVACPFWIMCMASYPWIVRRAAWNPRKPCLAFTRRLIAR